jgi:pimeloyl-ACP methyl ester carboxylesterase
MHANTTSSRTVVALHSSGAGARQWEPYRSLIDPAWRFVAPDLIGYDGATAWPVGGLTSLDAEARRVAEVMDGIGAVPMHLVGHSYGGSVALQVALRWPRRVASLTLFEPVRFALLRGHDEAAWRDIVAAGRRIGGLALAGRMHESAQAFVDYWSGARAWRRLGPARQDAVARRMPKVQAEFEALFEDAVSPAEYGRLTMPLHLVCGRESPAPARRVAERLVQLHPHARLTRWPGADHMAPLTQVERFARLLPGALKLEQGLAA